MRQGRGRQLWLLGVRKSRVLSPCQNIPGQTKEVTSGPLLVKAIIKLCRGPITGKPGLLLVWCLAIVGLVSFRWVAPVPQAHAQQVGVSTPFVGLRESYFESIGTSWAVRGKNWFVQFGGAPILPGFGTPGGANPGVQFGVGFVKGDCSGYLWVYGAQGCSRSLIGVTPTVMLPSGGVGWVADIAITPFVMGFIPVVGYAPIVGFCPVYVFPWQGRPWYCCPCWPGTCWWRPWYTGPGKSSVREKGPQPGEARGTGMEDLNERLRQAFPRHEREAFPRHAREAFPQGPWAKNAQSEGPGPAPRVAFVPAAGDFGEAPGSVVVPFLKDGRQVAGFGPEMRLEQVSSGSNSRGPVSSETGTQGSKSTAELPVASVAELAALRARELAQKEKEAQEYLDRGRKAQEEGRVGVAKVYYQMAARKSSGSVREAALATLAALNESGEIRASDSSRLARQESPRGGNDPLR